MIFDLDEFQEAKEKRKQLVYRSPLPVKKQRVIHYHPGRPCKVKFYTKEEIDEYQRSKSQR